MKHEDSALENKNNKPVAVVEVGADSEADPERARFIKSIKDYWENYQEYKEEGKLSFTERLDQEEIKAVHGLILQPEITFEEFKKEALSYHDSFEKIDDLVKILPQEYALKEFREIMKDIDQMRKLSWRLMSVWGHVISAYLNELEARRGEYVRSEEIFGTGNSYWNVEDFFVLTPPEREQFLSKHPELKEGYERFHIYQYPKLMERLAAIEQTFYTRMSSNYEEVKKYIVEMHWSDDKMDDETIDIIFGINDNKVEKKVDYKRLKEYGNEQFAYQGTPYEYIRDFLKELNLKGDDVLYDLGCGYGRIPLYGAMTTPGKYKGIEIVPERVEEANTIKNKFELDNVEFRQGNVLEQDYSDGSVFFLFNPFCLSTLEQVIEKLREIARNKRIRIVSYGPCNDFFYRQDWLKPIETNLPNTPKGRVKIFESV
ncbi:MAG: methyltransferase domain-containing protein [Patescibacteria group bacterium]